MSSLTLGKLDAREADPEAAREGSARSVVYFLAAASWLLMLMTFSPPAGRGSSEAVDALDAVAMAKLGARLLVFGALFVLALMQWNTSRRKLVMGLLLPWFVFAAWTVISAAWSPLRTVSLGQSGSFAVLLLLAFNIALRVQLADYECLLKQVTWGLLIACLLLLGIYLALPDWNCLTRTGRGLMHSTNGAATASIGCMLLVAARLLFGWKWSRVLLLPGITIFGATLILAQNRTALGVTCVVLMGLAASIAPVWRALAMAGIGIGGVVYLAIDLELGLTETILETVTSYVVRGQTASQLAALSGREEMWTKMWDSFLESPWFGHGYFVSSSKGEIYVWYAWTNWTAHNFWLQVLVSTGVVGGTFMAWGMAVLGVRIVRILFRAGIDRKLGVLFGSIFLWQIGWGINNESFVGPLQPESVVFFVILGLTTGRFADALIAYRKNREISSLGSTTFVEKSPLMSATLERRHSGSAL